MRLSFFLLSSSSKILLLSKQLSNSKCSIQQSVKFTSYTGIQVFEWKNWNHGKLIFILVLSHYGIIMIINQFCLGFSCEVLCDFLLCNGERSFSVLSPTSFTSIVFLNHPLKLLASNLRRSWKSISPGYDFQD